MKVNYINLSFRITEVLGYSTEELVGESLYNLSHGEDGIKLRKCHKDCKSCSCECKFLKIN